VYICAVQKILVLVLTATAFWAATAKAQDRPTIRDVLGPTHDSVVPDRFLDARVPDPEAGRSFSHTSHHINPSAEITYVFSKDYKHVRTLHGWIRATLPNESLVYQRSQTHFSPTHAVELSIFDPIGMAERQIYPLRVASEVRKNFVARVAEAYAARGEAWFREHNHHMDPEQFDATLLGGVMVAPDGGSMQFNVRFGDPGNGRDPLPFSEQVLVTCAPLAPLTRMACRESAVRAR